MKTEHTAAPAGPAFQSIKDVENNVKARMEKAIGDLQHEMATIRTGRANLGLLDHIRVDYYGTPSPLNQVATLHVPEPSLITITPVSYTHLDVYKRQVRLTGRKDDNKVYRHFTGYPGGLVAVSYTHLDVYKRQI